jgi:enterochelin esterase family protein
MPRLRLRINFSRLPCLSSLAAALFASAGTGCSTSQETQDPARALDAGAGSLPAAGAQGSGGGSGEAVSAAQAGTAGVHDGSGVSGVSGVSGGSAAGGGGSGGSAPSELDRTGVGTFVQLPPYVHGPASMKQAGVLEGTMTSFAWNDSQIFPDTQRNVYVYTPAQYDPARPTAFMVFQDGNAGFAYLHDGYETLAVLDNLTHAGDIPVAISIFIDASNSQDEGKNRSFEYDSVHDLYVRFVLEEIVPAVRQTHHLTDDPEGRVAIGESSGGIAAFLMAWYRPDQFRRVVSHSGSFVNLRGGDTVKDLVRESEPKPLRVYLQSGTNDYDRGPRLDWAAENVALTAALHDQGYLYRFVFGEDEHGGIHGAVDFPEALKWVWRGYSP